MHPAQKSAQQAPVLPSSIVERVVFDYVDGQDEPVVETAVAGVPATLPPPVTATSPADLVQQRVGDLVSAVPGSVDFLLELVIALGGQDMFTDGPSCPGPVVPIADPMFRLRTLAIVKQCVNTWSHGSVIHPSNISHMTPPRSVGASQPRACFYNCHVFVVPIDSLDLL